MTIARAAGAGNRRHHRSTNVNSASTAASAIGNEGPPVHIHGRPTVAEVSLAALRHNCRRVRELVGPGVAVLAVVKADAYGHGAGPAARALLAARAWGPRVSRGTEGTELPRAGG